MSDPAPIRSVHELIDAGLVSPADRAVLDEVASRYAVALTSHVHARMGDADAGRALAKQFVPQAAELRILPNELADPIGDGRHRTVAGVVHRYPDRALLLPLQICAVYCRFCFRREVVGTQQPEAVLSDRQLNDALDYVRATPTLWEVILSGGDPLLLSPRRLGALISALSRIDHVRVIRLHTRIPVVDPQRIDDALVGALETDRGLFVAVHANHPGEFSNAARAACRRLTSASVPLLGQTVLLREVNDDEQTLEALMRTMVENRIKPYYLHHGDLAPGTGHFRVSIARGLQLMEALRGSVSGLCQPTYVIDLPGGAGKVPLGPTYATRTSDGDWQLRDRHGALHRVADLV